MIKIEKNIPLTSNSGRPKKFPFEKMEAGDSFFVKGKDKEIHLARMSMMRENKACMTHKWVSRRVDGGLRIWCMEK